MSVNSGDRPWPQRLAHEDLDWPSNTGRILVPFRDAVNLNETGLLGASITFGTDGELYLLHAVDVDKLPDTDEIRKESELEMEIRDRFSVPVTRVEEAYSPELLDSFIESQSITATVLDSEEKSLFSGGQTEKTVVEDCHSIVGTRMDMFDSPSSILVPVAKGPHSGLATRVAEAMARAYDCWIELFHVIPEDASEEIATDANGLLDAYEYRLDDDVEVDHHIVRASNPTDTIIEHTNYHSLTILGAPEKGKLRRFLFGSTTDEVKQNVSSGPLLTVHRNMTESVISRWF